MSVWCVFFISDETLAWELGKIFHAEFEANAYAKRWEEADGVEHKVECWHVK